MPRLRQASVQHSTHIGEYRLALSWFKAYEGDCHVAAAQLTARSADECRAVHEATISILEQTRAQGVGETIESPQLLDLLSDHEESEAGASVFLHREMRILGTRFADARSCTVRASVGNPCKGNPITVVRLGPEGPEIRELELEPRLEGRN
jgi:hypothetical protein